MLIDRLVVLSATTLPPRGVPARVVVWSSMMAMITGEAGRGWTDVVVVAGGILEIETSEVLRRGVAHAVMAKTTRTMTALRGQIMLRLRLGIAMQFPAYNSLATEDRMTKEAYIGPTVPPRPNRLVSAELAPLGSRRASPSV